MKFHIVSENEGIRKIAFLYNLDIEEIKKENRHIRNWEKLIPGTKLKIPVISEEINQTLNEFEPFIEDYYPKLDLNLALEEEKVEEKEVVKKVVEEKIENEEIKKDDRPREERKTGYNYPYPPFYYPYMYPMRPIIYVMRRKK